MPSTFSARVLGKGRALLEAGAVYATGEPGLWTVIGSNGGYVVTVSDDLEVATCSCPHGRHHPAASCSHVAAVLLSLRDSADR